MAQNEEYHDPDYAGAPEGGHQGATSGSEVDKVEKIRRIVRREFSHELEARKNDIMLLEQRSLLARRMLHRLRYALVNKYYNDERLQLGIAQIQDEVEAQSEPRAQASVSTLLREGQRRLHPSVRKLLGKRSSTVELHEILCRQRAPRNSRKDYSAMLQVKKTSTGVGANNASGSSVPDASATCDSQVTSVPKKPRSLQPEVRNVVTVDDPTRNQTKHRYRIIIGNTSKYAPPASSADKSTHKWLLYVRGPPSCPTLGILKGVTVKLHHSYAPHHTLHIDKPPYHISRRGWGEFPAKVELHFALPERNRPVTVEHTIKLDRHYTGFQTLGAETIVDVWLYSTEDMLKYEFKEEDDVIKSDSNTQADKDNNPLLVPKQEIVEKEENCLFQNNVENSHTENWLDFFSNTTEMDVDEMIIKPQKKKEDRPDLENMIESSVIPKDNTEEYIIPDIIPDGKVRQVALNSEVKVKTEPQYDDTTQNSCEQTNMVDSTCKKMLEDIPNELLSQTNSPKKRIMKYMDPTTGKIYYLEMDRNLDLSKVQEIVINSKGNIKTAKISPIKSNGLKNVRKNKKGVSLLKPEVKSLLKNETAKVPTVPKVSKHSFSHIENDHCYLGPAPFREPEQILNKLAINYSEPINIKQERSVYDTVLNGIQRLNSVKVAVDFCLRKVPLVSAEARDPDFVKHFPFVVETEEKYWKLDFAKRRNFEWSRAKLINKLLTEHLHTTETIWRTKQILIYSRMHGYYPVRPEIQQSTISETDWSSWIDFENRKGSVNLKETFPNASDISSLTKFDENFFCQNLSDSIEIIDSDEEVDILRCNKESPVKRDVLADCASELPVLPVLNTDERLRFLFVEKKCADIGIELRNENVGSGYSYSCVHAVLLSAMKSFASELIRSALAVRQSSAQPETDGGMASVWQSGGGGRRATVSPAEVWEAARSGSAPRLHALTARALGTHALAPHKHESL